jgi:hypothetical protein
MTMDNIKAGEYITLASGEYSDYYIRGLAIALVDINTDEVRNDYINKYPEQTSRYEFKDDLFCEYLINCNLIKIIPYKEWYMGSYSSISDMTVYAGNSRWN